MVFTLHYLGTSWRWITGWGWTGVDVFFVLSGFLITGILYDARNDRRRFSNFYVRRTLRIFPLYYGVLLAGVLLTPIFHWAWHPAFRLWPFYLGNYSRFVYTRDFLRDADMVEHLRSLRFTNPPFLLYYSHLWSLCIEEQFYLVWPLVVFLVRDRTRLMRICAVTCWACLILRISCLFVVPREWIAMQLLYRVTPLRADALLIGGLVALALRGPEKARVELLARRVLLVGTFGLPVFEWFYWRCTHAVFIPLNNQPIMGTFGLSMIDLLAASLLVLAVTPTTVPGKVLSFDPLRRLGRISYGFYVFHEIPHLAYQGLVQRFFPTSSHQVGFTAIAALIGTIGLAYSSFHLVETPILRLNSYFQDSSESSHVDKGSAATAAAAAG